MARGSPGIKGTLEISKSRDGILIAGDPEALRSLAKLLTWLADFDQESHANMPDGERCHVHLHAGDQAISFNSLTEFSLETELCRLDGKGTGEFPERYRESGRNRKGRGTGPKRKAAPRKRAAKIAKRSR